jgi:hypothetical protein
MNRGKMVRTISKFAIAVVLFACAVSTGRVEAQTPIAVTATITDPAGLPYSNANVQAQLVPTGGTPTIIVNGIPAAIGGQQNATTDVSGSFRMNLFCNQSGNGCSVITAGGANNTQWQFTVQETGIQPPAGTGPQTFSVTVTLSGAGGLSQNVSSTLSAAAPALSRLGAGTLTGAGTTGFVPKWTSATALGNSLCDDGVTSVNVLTCADTGGIAAPSVSTGSTPPSITAGTAGLHGMAEGTAPTGLANVDIFYANAANHCMSANNNNVDRGCVSTAKVELCGTTSVCGQTIQVAPVLVYGTVALSSGTPSTATLSALPFTGSTTYVCVGTDQTNAANNLIKFANASASSSVITGPNTITDVIGYQCVGN